MTTFHVGSCRSCGQGLITVEGAETYHPASVEWPGWEGERCPRLLIIPGTENYPNGPFYSRKVPESENDIRETITL